MHKTVLSQLAVYFFVWQTMGLALAQTPPDRFRQADRNGDGRLSRDEVPGPSFDEMDVDQDDSVTVEEAVSWARRTGFGQPRSSASDPATRPSAEMPRSPARSSSDGGNYRIERGIDYAGTGMPFHRLDLALPNQTTQKSPLPLVVYIHGGGWEGGNRDSGRPFLAPILETGNYAVASIEYRLSKEAKWPAQLHDCKAAIRWLRAHADDFGFDEKNIAVAGQSAGGHLAAMLGVTNGASDLEGDVGQDRKVSSAVSCVIDFYGPTDLRVLGDPLGDTPSPISKLLGGSTIDKAAEAKEASPVQQVDPSDVPFLIVHGTRDSVVPIDQSERLVRALEKAKVPHYFTTVTGGQHGGFRNQAIPERTIQFLDRYLRGQSVSIDQTPVNP